MSLAIAFSIIATLVSVPALFISVYVLVCLKARDLSERMLSTPNAYSTDRAVITEFKDVDNDSGPGIYDIGGDDHQDYEDL